MSLRLMATVLIILSTAPIFTVAAQDAVIAAPNNYKVEFENESVRVVRVTYAPHEKSPMHEHEGNAAVIIVLKDGGKIHFINGDGSTVDRQPEKAGSVRFATARKPYKHAGENVSDQPLETIRVELKPPSCSQK